LNELKLSVNRIFLYVYEEDKKIKRSLQSIIDIIIEH